MANEFVAQLRPKTNNAELIYEATQIVNISYIYVTNVSDATAHVSIYVAPQGQAFGKDTAIIYRQEVNAEDTDIIGFSLPLLIGMKVGVWSSASGAVNFTVFGGSSVLF